MNYPSAPTRLPPESHRRWIEEQAAKISDPVQKLKFLQQAMAEYYQVAALRAQRSPKAHSKGGQADSDSARPPARRARVFLLMGLSVVLLAGGVLLLTILGNELHVAQTGDGSAEAAKMGTFYPIPPKQAEQMSADDAAQKPVIRPEYLDKQIWMVETKEDSEFYSNRLKIYTSQTTDNEPRRWYSIPVNMADRSQIGPERTDIAGILYHASESDVYEFRPEMTQSIRDYSAALIRYLRKKKAYNYFIDRFGQVYRLVREDHVAYHGGNGIWMDAKNIYLDLNNAFIGICFEGRDFEEVEARERRLAMANGDPAPHMVSMDKSSINEAQLRSGKELTDWLRVKYHIPQHNCVPHCLVSVNPYDFLIGHHLDLSHDFPFDMYGLSDKYREKIPAISEFGFSFNNYFIEMLKGRIWPGLARSEEDLQLRADAHNMPLDDYRRLLNNRFNRLFKWYKQEKKENIDIQ